MGRLLPMLMDLLGLIEEVVPVWVLVLLGLALAPFLFVRWVAYVRLKQVRGKLRTAFRTVGGPEREQLIADAFQLAGDSQERVIALGQTALTMGLTVVVKRAIARAEALGAPLVHLRALREAVSPKKAVTGHPLEQAVRVERFLVQGVLLAAREHLDAALQKWPDDAELQALLGRLVQAERARDEAVRGAAPAEGEPDPT